MYCISYKIFLIDSSRKKLLSHYPVDLILNEVLLSGQQFEILCIF